MAARPVVIRANVWLGVTAETQETADLRIPELLEVPAVVHFASCEPLLGPLDLTRWLDGPGGCLDLVIVGAEKLAAGKPGRPCRLEWVRAIRDQCLAADVPLFVKQLARGDRIEEMPQVDGRRWDQMPGCDP